MFRGIMPGLSTGSGRRALSAFRSVPDRFSIDRRKSPMLKKLLVALIASAFAFTAFAQAPKADTAPKAPAGTEAKKDSTTPAPKADTKPAKGEKKAKAKGEKKAKGKGKAKSDEAKK